jgi:hypothetical protein
MQSFPNIPIVWIPGFCPSYCAFKSHHSELGEEFDHLAKLIDVALWAFKVSLFALEGAGCVER